MKCLYKLSYVHDYINIKILVYLPEFIYKLIILIFCMNTYL